ncbi:MAG: hypothetical protein WBIAU1_06310 [Wolbachia endosymbiont of Drosophila biauraria]|nr:MAG: hypothetical protein WBIAU1_06310 [Wolbachia endosymbiont of Drosophila biauraria]
MFSQKDIENSQGQPVNKVEISNDKEYNERVEKKKLAYQELTNIKIMKSTSKMN